MASDKSTPKNNLFATQTNSDRFEISPEELTAFKIQLREKVMSDLNEMLESLQKEGRLAAYREKLERITEMDNAFQMRVKLNEVMMEKEMNEFVWENRKG